MIGLTLCNALALFYGTAYLVHSIRTRRIAAAVCVTAAAAVLIGLTAMLFVLRAA